MGHTRHLILVGMVLLAGCATQQPYLATHANSSQLARIHNLHVVSVITQDKLQGQYNTTYMNPVVTGTPIVPALAGGLIASVLISAEANHEAHEFAERHIAPLLATLAGYDGRAAVRESLHQGLGNLPVHITEWKTVDSKTKDSDLLPANVSDGSAWMILRTRYSMTPDFSGVQVITSVKLYEGGQSSAWRSRPVYKNLLTYQSPLLQMPPKDDAVRAQMTDAENAAYAKLDVDAQIKMANDGSPYDPDNAARRHKIHDEQWQHQAKLKQIASPYWAPDERADHFVAQWQKDNAQALEADVTEGGVQTARMLALDLDQQQPDLSGKSKRAWVTVYHDAQRTIQDAPDGEVYSVANGDVTHEAVNVHQTVRIHVSPTG